MKVKLTNSKMAVAAIILTASLGASAPADDSTAKNHGQVAAGVAVGGGSGAGNFYDVNGFGVGGGASVTTEAPHGAGWGYAAANGAVTLLEPGAGIMGEAALYALHPLTRDHKLEFQYGNALTGVAMAQTAAGIGLAGSLALAQIIPSARAGFLIHADNDKNAFVVLQGVAAAYFQSSAAPENDINGHPEHTVAPFGGNRGGVGGNLTLKQDASILSATATQSVGGPGRMDMTVLAAMGFGGVYLGLNFDNSHVEDECVLKNTANPGYRDSVDAQLVVGGVITAF